MAVGRMTKNGEGTFCRKDDKEQGGYIYFPPLPCVLDLNYSLCFHKIDAQAVRPFVVPTIGSYLCRS